MANAPPSSAPSAGEQAFRNIARIFSEETAAERRASKATPAPPQLGAFIDGPQERVQEQIPQQLDDTEEPQAVMQIIRENDLPSLHDEEEPAAMAVENTPQLGNDDQSQAELPAVRPGKLLLFICQCSRNHLLALKIQNFHRHFCHNSTILGTRPQ